MASINRDIAAILGATENANNSNTALATVNDLSAGVTVYATVDDLPLSDVEAGSQAYVSATQRLYIWTGAGWFNIALINTSPSISVSGSSPIELDNSGGTTTITVTSTDPEEVPITFTAVTDAAFDDFATVTNVDGVFTITPKPAAISAGTNDTGSITFKASDGVNIATADRTTNLIFQSIDSLTSSTNSINEGGVVTFYLNVTGYSNGTTFPYTITGVSSADLDGIPLTGNIDVVSDTAALDVALLSDATTEGTETITFSAGGLTKQVTVNDTSLTPVWLADFATTSASVISGPAAFFSFGSGSVSMTVNSDGSKIYCAGSSTGQTYQNSLTTPNSLTGGVTINGSAGLTGAYGLAFGDNGTKIAWVNNTLDDVNVYNLATAYEVVSTRSNLKTVSLNENVSSQIRGLCFGNNGSVLVVGGGVDQSSARLFSLSLSTPYDVSTANTSVYDTMIVSSQLGNSNAVVVGFSSDGSKIYAHDGLGTQRIAEFSLNTNWDIGSGYSSSRYKDLGYDYVHAAFTGDGNYLYTVTSTSDVRIHDMS